ncbi:hypothetical protein OPQ81_003021 [Rhizoctonia solani]|nr:hypothetical protein OPQ81_003021 [Rhizoctonia solani]
MTYQVEALDLDKVFHSFLGLDWTRTRFGRSSGNLSKLWLDFIPTPKDDNERDRPAKLLGRSGNSPTTAEGRKAVHGSRAKRTKRKEKRVLSVYMSDGLGYSGRRLETRACVTPGLSHASDAASEATFSAREPALFQYPRTIFAQTRAVYTQTFVAQNSTTRAARGHGISSEPEKVIYNA